MIDALRGVFLSKHYYNMGVKLFDENSNFEHVSVEYGGGARTLRFREYNQTIKLFKRVEDHGDHTVVVSSSGWVEMEQTSKRYESRSYVMLDSGRFLNIDEPSRDREFDDECCIVKISKLEVD
jgi:hypothetical protein